ncbi:hypothetical protein PILCRDRAFT_565044 [Piloderma croceum F 1598]|uniref:Uncharacterized protein n=1 Tax=Piloderma croceum (strain F 1598) TaxID=765440 RepID=A0A0C3AZB6_PILCF|nr:hypothetical protein PILCRDRAFT_565044 [Piloderma croceum F 1598]
MRSPKTVIKRGAVTQVDVGADMSLPTSASIGTAMEFTCSCNESAILVLPDGASDTNMRKPERLLDFLTADVALQWLDATESSSLILVTGCVKSRSWGVASVSNTSRQVFVSLNFSAAQVGGRFTGSYSWQSSNGGHHRDGPHPPSNTQNQCVFMRGFKMSSRKSLIPGGKRVAITDVNGSKIHDLKRSKRRRNRLSGSSHSSTSGTSQGSHDSCVDAEGQKSDDEEIFIEEFTDVSQPYHPSDTINHYLLNEVRASN